MRPLVVAVLLALGIMCPGLFRTSTSPPSVQPDATKAEVSRMLQHQPAPFVPNLGQWEHPARFVQRTGPLTVFVEDRGWLLNLQEQPRIKERTGMAFDPAKLETDKEILRGVAVRMSFLGTSPRSRLVGEEKLPGYSNYFLGNDESRWSRGHCDSVDAVDANMPIPIPIPKTSSERSNE